MYLNELEVTLALSTQIKRRFKTLNHSLNVGLFCMSKNSKLIMSENQ